MRLPPLSIRVKLPLLICALVLAVAGSFTWAAYRGVSEAVVVTASDRLGSVTTQIAGLLQTSATQLLANARAVADSPAVRAYLRAPAPRMRAAALAAMRPVGPAAQQIADVELVSTGGARLLSLTDSASHGTPAVNPEMVLAGSRSDSGVIRPSRDGRFIWYELDGEALVRAEHWLRRLVDTWAAAPARKGPHDHSGQLRRAQQP